MKPETAAAMGFINTAYHNPGRYTPDEIIRLWREEHLGLYMQWHFTFVYLVEKPYYSVVDDYYTDCLRVYGGKYHIVTYPDGILSEKMEWLIDANNPSESINYYFDENSIARPLYKHYCVNDFTKENGIIIYTLHDYCNIHQTSILYDGTLYLPDADLIKDDRTYKIKGVEE